MLELLFSQPGKVEVDAGLDLGTVDWWIYSVVLFAIFGIIGFKNRNGWKAAGLMILVAILYVFVDQYVFVWLGLKS